ncbi:MAG: MFS transporter [Roseiflexaceae bacterium]
MFQRLWVGQTISQFGSQIGSAALRYTALLILAASPSEMAWLSAAAMLPALLLGLPIGTLVDRHRRRPLLIAADLGRGLLLLAIPIAYALGWLRIELLYLLAALAGTLSVLFDSAYHAFLPSVVARDDLIAGNSRLSMSDSVAEVAGPPIGGLLVQLIGGPLTIVADALSFFGSALAIGSIPNTEAEPAQESGTDWRSEMTEGVQAAWADLRLRALLATAITRGVVGGLIGPLYDLYLVRELAIRPFWVGLTIGIGGVSALFGATLANRLVQRWGLGRTLITSLIVSGLTTALIPLATGPFALGLLILAQSSDAAQTIYAINEVSFRQTIVPDRLLGRVGAVFGLLPTTATLLGALATSALVMVISLRDLLFIAALIAAASSIWLIGSPIRAIQQYEQPPTA